MKFTDPLNLLDYLLKEHPTNLIEGLESLESISDEIFHETKQLILAHNKNLQKTQFHQSISHSTELLSENIKIEDLIGKHISHFTLEALLGSGGMGVVYLAKRNDGKFEQTVAIKVIYPTITALHGPQNLTREAQYLALLNHPNIAGVLDAGECEFGMYMVMEYIEGTTLLSYCDEENLNTKQRLSLFCKVCDAVSYAHQNRVIHADLKPSNILVNKQGEPKLVDFGVARTISNEQADFVVNEYIKALSQEYASPEQLAGKTLTTQSDVYSLGGILKALLREQLNHFEIEKLIEASTAIQIENRLKSVNEITTDIEHLINNTPLGAVYYSSWQLLKKSIQRNTFIYFSVLSTLILLFAFTTTLQLTNNKLEAENDKNIKLLSFLSELISAADIEGNVPRDYSVKELIIKGSKKVDLKFKEYEEQAIILKKTLSRGLINLGNFSEGYELLKDTNLSLIAQDEVLEVLLNLGSAQHGLSNFKQAYEYYLKIEALIKQTNNYEHAVWLKTIPLMASVLSNLGQVDTAIEKLNTLNVTEALIKKHPLDVAEVYRMTAQVHARGNNSELAKKNMKKVFEITDKYADKNSVPLILMINTAGDIAFQTNELVIANQHYSNAHTLAKKLLGEEHPTSAATLRSLSTVQEMQGELKSARSGYLKVKDIFYTMNGKNSITAALILSDLGIVNKKMQQYDKSLEYFKESLEIYTNVLGYKNRDVANLTTKVADIYYLTEDYSEAAALYQDAINNYAALPGNFKNHVGVHTASLVKCLLKLKQNEQLKTKVHELNILLEENTLTPNAVKKIRLALDEVNTNSHI